MSPNVLKIPHREQNLRFKLMLALKEKIIFHQYPSSFIPKYNIFQDFHLLHRRISCLTRKLEANFRAKAPPPFEGRGLNLITSGEITHA